MLRGQIESSSESGPTFAFLESSLSPPLFPRPHIPIGLGETWAQLESSSSYFGVGQPKQGKAEGRLLESAVPIARTRVLDGRPSPGWQTERRMRAGLPLPKDWRLRAPQGKVGPGVMKVRNYRPCPKRPRRLK
jgi:hypothetical protein